VTPSIRKKLAITLPTSGGRSVGIVRSRTQTMEFSFSLSLYLRFGVQKMIIAKSAILLNVTQYEVPQA
jgi:hypothetical protein